MAKGEVCSIDGCNKFSGSSGGWKVCAMHYSRWRRNQSYDLLRIRMTHCRAPDCKSPKAINSSLCNTHKYSLQRYNSFELPSKNPSIKPENCKIPGCDKVLTKNNWNYCSMHVNRFRRNGSYDLQKKIKIPEGFEYHCSIHGFLKDENFYSWKNKKAKRCRTCATEYEKDRRYLEEDENLTQRECARCKQIKLKEQFRPHDWKLRSSYCDECRSELIIKDYDKHLWHLKRNYGLTKEQYNNILNKQKNVCAICKQSETDKYGVKSRDKIKNLSVDHCHESDEKETRKIRGLLCGSCNRALGLLREDSSICRQMIKYIEERCINPEFDLFNYLNNVEIEK